MNNNQNNIIETLTKVNIEPKRSFYNLIHEKIERKEKAFVITANPEIVMLGRSNDGMKRALNKAIIIPDGIGVVWALRRLGIQCDRNTGIEFVNDLLEYADAEKLNVFIYGASEEVLNTFLIICEERWPGITISGAYNGYDYCSSEMKNKISFASADICLIALGAPKQELFIDSIYDSMDKGVYVGIGGSLDVLSGKVKRAPAFFINNNMEWLYRIINQPKRMKRFLRGNIVFVFLFLITKCKMQIKKIDY